MKKEIVEKIETLIRDMELPIFRKQIKNKSNARWLMRNIKVKNNENGNVDVVIDLLKKVI